MSRQISNLRYKTKLEVSEEEWVNPILDIIWVNSLGLGGLQLLQGQIFVSRRLHILSTWNSIIFFSFYFSRSIHLECFTKSFFVLKLNKKNCFVRNITNILLKKNSLINIFQDFFFFSWSLDNVVLFLEIQLNFFIS